MFFKNFMVQSFQMDVSGKNILILRLGALGDIVHTTVIAQAIKNAYPNCKITYCVEDRYAEVIENTSYIDKIIPYDTKQRKKFGYNLKLALMLRKEKFDVIFNLTNALRNNIISLIVNPKTLIFHKKDRNIHVVENFFNTASERIDNLTLPQNLSLGVCQKSFERVKNDISAYKRPYFIFSPGGSSDKNRQGRIWNKNYWIMLGNLLVQEFGGTVIITGAKNELEFHKQIADGISNSVIFTGKLSLTEIKCLYKQADLFIAGDTGPLHIASALGIDTLGIFGSTDVKNVAPYGEKGHYVCPDTEECRFCWEKHCRFLKDDEIYTPCMQSIKPKKVFELIKSKIMLRCL